jgi:hypothetical protein
MWVGNVKSLFTEDEAVLFFVISICLSVRMVVHMEQLGSQWKIF